MGNQVYISALWAIRCTSVHYGQLGVHQCTMGNRVGHDLCTADFKVETVKTAFHLTWKWLLEQKKFSQSRSWALKMDLKFQWQICYRGPLLWHLVTIIILKLLKNFLDLNGSELQSSNTTPYSIATPTQLHLFSKSIQLLQELSWSYAL